MYFHNGQPEVSQNQYGPDHAPREYPLNELPNYQPKKPKISKENEPPIPQCANISNKNKKRNKTRFLGSSESSKPNEQSNAALPDKDPKVHGTTSSAVQPQSPHIYVENENNKSIIRCKLTDKELDAMFDSPDSVNKELLKFDERLFSDAIHEPIKREYSHMKCKYRMRIHYRCIVNGCRRLFGNKANFKEHYLYHCGIKPFKCKVKNCNSRHTTKRDLNRHIPTHTVIKGFKCPFCDFVTDEIKNMNDHVVIHPKIDRNMAG
ncbi:Krueppel-like factor 9 [Thelohanellus kitauei]|uniref:Krueppel-like factor 9 n=1 Tax=Thelohanellus kitauei TaxID=669202 RepID=A0A0C2J3C5_THEKT|nr:Krueppel-like factor 9 [Thelohanellus kitauei]